MIQNTGTRLIITMNIRLLTHETFPKLEVSHQQAYLERFHIALENKQGEDKEYQSTRHPSLSSIICHKRLFTIKDSEPSEDLQKEFKRPDPEDLFQFLSYSYGVRTGWVSPKTSKELAGMTPAEVLSELKKPLPSDRTSFDEPTRDGLAVEASHGN